jgi:hypothetical protein
LLEVSAEFLQQLVVEVEEALEVSVKMLEQLLSLLEQEAPGPLAQLQALLCHMRVVEVLELMGMRHGLPDPPVQEAVQDQQIQQQLRLERQIPAEAEAEAEAVLVQEEPEVPEL